MRYAAAPSSGCGRPPSSSAPPTHDTSAADAFGIERVVEAARGHRGGRHRPALGGRRRLDQPAAAGLLDGLKAERPVREPAAQDHGGASRPVALGERHEQRIPQAAGEPGVDPEPPARTHESLPGGGRDVDDPLLQRTPVGRLDHRERRRAAEEVDEHRSGRRSAVLDADHGCGEPARQVAQHGAGGRERALRSDHDHDA
jgi:hypothetical protein